VHVHEVCRWYNIAADELSVLPFKGSWIGCSIRLKGITWYSTRRNAKSCVCQGITSKYIMRTTGWEAALQKGICGFWRTKSWPQASTVPSQQTSTTSRVMLGKALTAGQQRNSFSCTQFWCEPSGAPGLLIWHRELLQQVQWRGTKITKEVDNLTWIKAERTETVQLGKEEA